MIYVCFWRSLLLLIVGRMVIKCLRASAIILVALHKGLIPQPICLNLNSLDLLNAKVIISETKVEENDLGQFH